MKCSICKFYVKSTLAGNYCKCSGNKPCEIERNERKYKAKLKRKKRYERI